MLRTLLLTALALPVSALPALAQQPQPGPTTMTGPTTKVLAIGHIVGTPTPALRNIMPQEVTDTVNLYLAGKIDQWYARKDQNGVVFLMNVATVEEAHTLLEALPLGVAKKMEFELIPLGPLTPLRFLTAPTPAPAGDAK